MTSCPIFSCLSRLIVLGFFALSAWNTINDLKTHSENFSGKYQVFQKRVETLVGKEFHEHIHHDKVTQFSEQIVLYISYAIMTFCVLGLLKPCAGTIPAFLWLFNQILEHEFLELTQNRNLKQLEVLALTSAVFVSALLVSCNNKKGGKCCPKKNTNKPAPSTSTKSKASNKRGRK